MASAPLLDFAALAAPLPGAKPAGTSIPLVLRQKLEAARKDFEVNPENPALAPVAKIPDWALIQRLATEALTRTSKDLEIAFRLCEALVKLHGFAGLRDGLHLLRELATHCWDRLHPMPDEGEGMEVRGERFYWITETDKGARFPHSVRAIPLVQVKGQKLSYQDVLLGMQGQGPVPAEDLESAEPASPDVAGDLTQCFEELDQLERLLDEKCAPNPPSFTGLHQALDECQGFMSRVTRRESAAAETPGANGAVSSAGGAEAGKPLVVASREEAYRQLSRIADVLEQLEPHSPIPDLLRRAIELGKMPFRQLIQELVREPGLLSEVRREFGLKTPESAPDQT